MAIIGYAWASCDDEEQDFDCHEALTTLGCKKVFGNRASSADQRPNLATSIAGLLRGHLLIVRLDHLGYRTEPLNRFVGNLTDRGIGFRAINTAFDTTPPAGRSLLRILSALGVLITKLCDTRILLQVIVPAASVSIPRPESASGAASPAVRSPRFYSCTVEGPLARASGAIKGHGDKNRSRFHHYGVWQEHSAHGTG